MEYCINGFSSISNEEMLNIDGGRDIGKVVIGAAGVVAIGAAVVTAAIYCPAAINKGTLTGAAVASIACLSVIINNW